MSLHINDLEYLRAGWQKVVNSGQYGSTIYVFKAGDALNAVTNKSQGIGTLIETITVSDPDLIGTPSASQMQDIQKASHGFNRSEPADFGVIYEGNGGKL